MKRVSSSSGITGTFHLVHFEPPPKDIRTTTESLCFFVDEGGKFHSSHSFEDKEDVFRLCKLDFDPEREEKALILKVQILYSHNDYDEFWTWEGSFHPPEGGGMNDTSTNGEGGGKHPDSTGRLKIIVPRSFKGPLPTEDRLIYEPKLVHLGVSILPYVGLENHILGARSTCLTQAGIAHEYQAFRNNDPFLLFLLEYKDKFDETNTRDIIRYDQIVLVKRHLVKRVQQFFENAIFPLFRYVSNDPTIVFKWEKKPQNSGFVNVVVQVDYVVVTPEIPKYKMHGVVLNI